MEPIKLIFSKRIQWQRLSKGLMLLIARDNGLLTAPTKQDFSLILRIFLYGQIPGDITPYVISFGRIYIALVVFRTKYNRQPTQSAVSDKTPANPN